MDTAPLTQVLGLPQAFLDAESPSDAVQAVDGSDDILVVGRIAYALQLLGDEQTLSEAVQDFRTQRPRVTEKEIKEVVREFLRHSQVTRRWAAFKRTLQDKRIRRFAPVQEWVPQTEEQKFQKAVAKRDGDFRSVNLAKVPVHVFTEALATKPNLFENAHLSPRLSWISLENVHLKGARLYSADLTGTNLTGADLSGAKLVFAKMEGTFLGGARLPNADLRGIVIKDVDLSRVDMRGANLSLSSLSEVSLEGADLRGANLNGATLRNVRIAGADFSGADLRKTGLTKEAMQKHGAIFSSKTEFGD